MTLSAGFRSRRARRSIIATGALSALLSSATAALAVDHTNLEEGLPVEVTDAYPLEYLGREVQARLQYRRTAEGEHEIRLDPRFELGLPYNGQLALHAPLVTTFADEDTEFYLGRIGFEFLYNLNQETLGLPALALVAGVEAPDTRDGGSFDPFGRVILTKMIPGSTLWHRVHLNALLQGNIDRSEDERAFRYQLAAGYDVRLSATAVGVVDAVRDQPLREQPASNFGELGARLQIAPLLVIAFGGGAGASDDGDFVARATAAFQWFAF